MLHEQVPGHLSIRGRTEPVSEEGDDTTMRVKKRSEKVFPVIDPKGRFVRRMAATDTLAQRDLLAAGTKSLLQPHCMGDLPLGG